jgi:ribulose-phosphate 3-epimerase
VKPGTDIDALDSLGDALDMILVMTVEPGFGGQSFMSDMLGKVRRARAMADRAAGDVWVQVDGGVGPETIESCAEAGANVFVAGSAVFRSEDPAATVERLRTLADGAARSPR